MRSKKNIKEGGRGIRRRKRRKQNVEGGERGRAK